MNHAVGFLGLGQDPQVLCDAVQRELPVEKILRRGIRLWLLIGQGRLNVELRGREFSDIEHVGPEHVIVHLLSRRIVALALKANVLAGGRRIGVERFHVEDQLARILICAELDVPGD